MVDCISQNNNSIQIDMLGGFSIRVGDHVITHNKGRTKQVWMLIEYLVANRNKEVSIDKIIELLWPEDECSNPLNALKNLVYRARLFLKDLASDKTTEYIVFTRNTYAWNQNLQCNVDVEQFELCWKAASNSCIPREKQIQKYYEALNLYKGEFLPKSSFANWVISANAYYSTIYNECVIKLSNLLMDEKCFDDVIKICEGALTYSLYEEKIHKVLLNAYIASHNYNKALEHYNYTNNLFYKEFGVRFSDSFAGVYTQMRSGFTNIELNLATIKNELKEDCNQEGAFYCDYNVFKNLYRVEARSISRTGKQVYIALITLCRNGNFDDCSIKRSTLDILKNSIISSLERDDVVSAYSGKQFIIMLPFINYENAQMAVNRIQKLFQEHYQKNDVQILTKINSVDSISL